jgi:hypothetical protein
VTDGVYTYPLLRAGEWRADKHSAHIALAGAISMKRGKDIMMWGSSFEKKRRAKHIRHTSKVVKREDCFGVCAKG